MVSEQLKREYKELGAVKYWGRFGKYHGKATKSKEEITQHHNPKEIKKRFKHYGD